MVLITRPWRVQHHKTEQLIMITQKSISEAHIAKMAHAIGLDNKQPDKSQFYQAYRNGSWYDKPDELWDDLVVAGFATVRRKPNDYGYSVSPKGMQFLANHYKIIINYTNEYTF